MSDYFSSEIEPLVQEKKINKTSVFHLERQAGRPIMNSNAGLYWKLQLIKKSKEKLISNDTHIENTLRKNNNYMDQLKNLPANIFTDENQLQQFIKNNNKHNDFLPIEVYMNPTSYHLHSGLYQIELENVHKYIKRLNRREKKIEELLKKYAIQSSN